MSEVTSEPPGATQAKRAWSMVGPQELGRCVTFETTTLWRRWLEQHGYNRPIPHDPLHPCALYHDLVKINYAHYEYGCEDFGWEEAGPSIDSPNHPVALLSVSDEQVAELERLTGIKADYGPAAGSESNGHVEEPMQSELPTMPSLSDEEALLVAFARDAIDRLQHVGMTPEQRLVVNRVVQEELGKMLMEE